MVVTKETSDAYDLHRFVTAQALHYDRALAELRAGKKQSHWIWYIFPQLAGLGASQMSKRYAIKNLTEAQAYLSHPILGRRLAECAAALNAHLGVPARDILSEVDAMKVQSSMTLFAKVSESRSVFEMTLELFFSGKRDPTTLLLLNE